MAPLPNQTKGNSQAGLPYFLVLPNSSPLYSTGSPNRLPSFFEVATMEKQETRLFKSYKSLFHIRFKIHNIGDRTLPRGLSFETLAMFAILYLPLWPLGRLLYPAHPWVGAVIAAGAAAGMLSQCDPQGKFLPLFILGLAEYFARPKTTDYSGRAIARRRKSRLEWKAMEVEEE
uniref:TcpE family protein n=2 Tax=Neomoorella thermoacetica TaxID=1525 RepID=Q2RLP8_MOOTA